ncbi:MAG: hypothetical protein ACP5I1_15050, partial [Candidatus Hinthialibacter sp.]
GMEHGVSVGDQFIIYELGGEISDPNSGQSLGKLELVKAKVEAMHVQEKISLVMPFHKESTTQSTVLSATLAQTTSSSSTDIYRDRLNIQKNQALGLNQINSQISVGDLVRSVAPYES